MSARHPGGEAATLLVISKGPVPGRVKTRLTPPYTPREAATLADAALAATLRTLRRASAHRRLLVLDGAPGPWLPPGFDVVPQAEGGLDERIVAAFAHCEDGPALLVGMDTPQLTPELLSGVGRDGHDDWLFPSEGACEDWGVTRTDSGLCVRINRATAPPPHRPTVPTVYPPVAEGWYFAVHTASPPDSRHKPLQVGGAVLAFGTTLALLAVLRRRGDPRRAPARAALWAWCPAVPFEAVNNAHIDTLGVLLAVLALGTATAGVRRGALLGAAVAVKLLPVLMLPGALSGPRSPKHLARLLSAVLAAVALAYLPYVAASGAGVLGYLPGYLHEEGYEPGPARRFALLRLLLPDAAGVAVVVLLALTALYVWLRGDPARPWRGALLLTGTALLLVSPSYPWYSLLVVALVALDGRWEWLTVTLADPILYLAGGSLPGIPLQTLTYGAAALAVVLGAFLRSNRTWRVVRRRLGRLSIVM